MWLQFEPETKLRQRCSKNAGFYVTLAWGIILAAACYIAVMVVLFYLIDVRELDILGLRTWLEVTRPSYSIFWVYAFTEASPTEYLQWLFISISMILSGVCFALRKKAGSHLSWGWLVLMTGLSLMLAEDYLNLRHKTVSVVARYLDMETSTSFLFLSLRSSVEIVLYAALGFIMVFALVVIIKDSGENVLGRNLMTVGYCFYAAASLCSATRGIGSWYARVGDAIIGRINGDMAARATHRYFRGRLGFYFVDFVFEESLELLGAALIVASLVVFVGRHLAHRRTTRGK